MAVLGLGGRDVASDRGGSLLVGEDRMVAPSRRTLGRWGVSYFPRWCRILCEQTALIGFIFGYSYEIHHRQQVAPAVPSYIWLDLAAEAAAFGRGELTAAHDLHVTAGVEPKLTDTGR